MIVPLSTKNHVTNDTQEKKEYILSSDTVIEYKVFFSEIVSSNQPGKLNQKVVYHNQTHLMLRVSMNFMKLVIPLHSLYWSIHTKDESKRETAFAFIFGVN